MSKVITELNITSVQLVADAEPDCRIKRTNADRIRTMAEPELAATLISADFCTVCDHYEDGLCKAIKLAEIHCEPLNNYCVEACLKWFQQPVEE